MKSYRIFAFVAVLAAVMASAAGVVRAQLDPTAPIVVRTLTTSKPAKTGSQVWLKAEVIHADSHSMVVREQANERMIHTFTYTQELGGAMQQIADAGGYQYGDKVKILYQPGQTVALKIHGRPSKPL